MSGEIHLDGNKWNRDKLSELCFGFNGAHCNEIFNEGKQDAIDRLLKAFCELQTYLQYGE